MNVKKNFNYIFQAKPAKTMANLEIDNNLIGWIQSILTKNWLLIDIQTWSKKLK